MATKLGLYNGALREINQRKLASLTEPREPRYALDDVYDDAIQHCLEQGQWKFAIRSVEIAASTSIDPVFGFANAFERPADWLRTAAICENDRFEPPLDRYLDESGYWFADVNPIYVRFVSCDDQYGLDLSAWPSLFTRYVEIYLASRIAGQITNSSDLVDRLEKRARQAKTEAASNDAMNGPAGRIPAGSWALSRGGSRSDRGR